MNSSFVKKKGRCYRLSIRLIHEKEIKLKETISTLRKRVGFTQKELAEKMNVSDKTISKWENGITEPDNKALVDLSKIFNISVDELLLGVVKPKKSKQKIIFSGLIFVLLITIALVTFSVIKQDKRISVSDSYLIISNNKELNLDGSIYINDGKYSLSIANINYSGKYKNKKVLEYYLYIIDDDILYYGDYVEENKETNVIMSDILKKKYINITEEIDNPHNVFANRKLQFCIEMVLLNREKVNVIYDLTIIDN